MSNQNQLVSFSLGALVDQKLQWHFNVWAPKIDKLFLEITNHSMTTKLPMLKESNGYFTLTLANLAKDTTYYYIFPSGIRRADPASRFQPKGIYGPSALVNPQTFSWHDKGWKGVKLEDYIIYELHVGTFSKQGTFKGVINFLDRLCQLGVTAVELMPIFQFPGVRNWGYDLIFPYAIQNSYGSPFDLVILVNACHSRGLAVILDVVYNHIGPEGNFLADFGDYFTDKYQSPWGKAINFDGANNQHVRRYFIEHALSLFEHYHIDALRLDAVHAIYDFSASPFLKELSDQVSLLSKKLNRRLYLIAESDLNDTKIIRSKKEFGYEMDSQWNDDFHHALYGYLSQENRGYYADFTDFECIPKTLTDGYAYTGQYSRYRKMPFGMEAKRLPLSKFVVFSQNHDQVGNRLRGDRIATLLSFQENKLAAAHVLLSPYIPLLFMGEEYGETNPFYFFTDFTDKQLIKNVRIGRKNEFKAFSWQGEVPDPQAIQTYTQSQLRRQKLKHNIILWKYYQTLIQLRKKYFNLSLLTRRNIQVKKDKLAEILYIQIQIKNTDIFLILSYVAKSVKSRIPIKRGVWKKIFDSEGKEWLGKPLLPTILNLDTTPSATIAPFSCAVYLRVKK